jgi:hypothetical protein
MKHTFYFTLEQKEESEDLRTIEFTTYFVPENQQEINECGSSGEFLIEEAYYSDTKENLPKELIKNYYKELYEKTIDKFSEQFEKYIPY